ncbi:GFA family protein [Cereibacter sediminicola]|uniref:GFA family protein n=1 Tax=Cereibacter sediminicola TaxID=2584941 RepID=UPI001FE7CC87|nr:GFA family protein [Cereibacter sediminicola]
MRGACLCGAVAFEADGEARPVVACHCNECRKWSGHFWAATSVPLDRFRLTRDEGLRWFRASDRASRGFCALCGSSLFWKPDDSDRMSFSPGALDGATGLRMGHHIFMAEAGDYYRVNDGTPELEGDDEE